MAARPTVAERMDRFRADLEALDTQAIVRKHIILGDCYILEDEEHFTLREEVARHFGLSSGEIVIVGSAKTGFSIAPHQRYKPFDDTSDVDLALVSGELFDGVWKAAYVYANSVGIWPDLTKFSEYLFRGWVRPDLLPRSEGFPIRTDWWEFFGALTRSEKYGPFKIRAGLYKSWFFLETYQSETVKLCQQIQVSRGVL
jgi:hypothetical protein